MTSIRAHLYDCAMLPAEVRRRTQAARDAARSLVKRNLELRDVVDVAMREAEAAIQSLRETLRKAPTRIGTKRPGHQIIFPTTSSLCTFRSETASATSPMSGKSPAGRTRRQAAKVSTLASGELINPPLRRIGRGLLTSVSACSARLTANRAPRRGRNRHRRPPLAPGGSASTASCA